MPIAINGAGTITGLSVGGLPDGTVDADTLASGVGGKVLQVVQTVKTDVFSTNSTSFVDITGLSATITPSATTSKILITGCLSYGGEQGATMKMNLVRGSTNIVVGDASGGNPESVYANFACDHPHATFSFSPMYMDSPNSTSALTYKIQIKSEGSSYYARINRCHQDSATQHSRNVSTFTVTEIGA